MVNISTWKSLTAFRYLEHPEGFSTRTCIIFKGSVNAPGACSSDSSGESSPWVGICVIDGRLLRVFYGPAPIQPSLARSLALSLSPRRRNVETGVKSDCTAHLCARTGVNNWSSFQLHILTSTKWFMSQFCSHFLDLHSRTERISSAFFPRLKKSLL